MNIIDSFISIAPNSPIGPVSVNRNARLIEEVAL